MKRLLMIICGFAAGLSAQSTGTVTGILTSTAGTAVPGASVAAYLQGAASTNGKFPPAFNALTASDGSFSLNGLLAGKYLLCAEQVNAALLNPCFWSASPTTVTVASGGSVTGVSLVAQLGVALNIRVNDPTSLISNNPKLNDIVIEVRPAIGPALPAELASKDSTGETFTVLAPQAEPATILVYSANFSLSDNQGDSFTTPNAVVTVKAPNVSTAGTPSGTPNLTLTIQGQASK